MKKILLLFALLCSVGSFAQMTGWQHSLPIVVNSTNTGNLTDYHLDLTVNTQQYISAGQMQANGADIRFGTSCGAQLFSYYISSGINTTTTRIFVKLPSVLASSTDTIYMFYGNASAAAATTLSTLNGPLSGTNQTANQSLSGSANSQRGFRFSPNTDILVTSFGKYATDGSTRPVTLFNFNTQAIISQNDVSGVANQFVYAQLTNPIWLTQGTQYIIEMFNAGATGPYYFGAAPTVNSNITYYDMRYCNGCTANTFPTLSLGGMLYGYVDFQFYTKNTATPAPTYTLGTPSTIPTVSITGPTAICPGEPASFTAVVNTPVNVHAWTKNSNPASNTNTYNDNALVGGDVIGITVIDSGLCIPASNSLTMTVNPTPTATLTSDDDSICNGGSTNINIALTGTPPFDFSYYNGTTTVNEPNHNSNTFSFPVSPSTDMTYIVSAITDGNGCVAVSSGMTDVAEVMVNDSAVITTQPLDASICTGDPVTFTSAASGSWITYQWYNGTTQLSDGPLYSGTTTPALTVSSTVGLGNIDYHMVATAVCGAPAHTDTVTLTEVMTNTWTGAVSTLWSVPGNWTCGSIPVATTNVIIPDVTNDPEIDIPGAICNSLTIDALAEVSFTGANNALEVKTSIVNNGTFDAALGRLILSGTVAQNVPGVTYAGLAISGGSDKVLDGDITVTGNLDLAGGHLILNDNNITLSDMLQQTGGSAASFIVTNDSGLVIGENMGADSVMFHVGISTASYTPVALQNIGDADTFSVRVMPNVFMDGYGVDPAQVDNPVVDRTWLVSENTAGGANVKMTPYWNGTEHLNGFTTAHVYVAHYTGGQWEGLKDGEAALAPAANGTDPYWTSADSIMDLSPFTVASSGQFPLSIKLATIAAKNIGKQNKVDWKSEREDAGDKYELEHSIDGRTFRTITVVSAKGKAADYTFLHKDAADGVNYYRLKLVSTNDKLTYSKVVSAVVAGDDNFSIEAFPNPVKNTVSISVKGDMKGTSRLSVTDIAGRVVKEATQVSGNTTELNLGQLPSGVYMINYTDDVHNSSVKITKQ